MQIFRLLLLLVFCGLARASDTLAESEPVSIAGSYWAVLADTGDTGNSP